jgi:hypothetical protein
MRSMPTSTHSVKPWKDKAGQNRRCNTQLAASPTQSGTGHQTSIGGNGPRLRQDDELEVPQKRQKDVTYGSFLCTVRPKKDKPNQTCFTAGSNRINYPGKVATPTADMLVAKTLLNSVISTRGV